MDKDFSTWLIDEMNTRGWSNSELARRANVVPSTVSMIVSRRKKPGIDFCTGIARALKTPPERVFRLAGLLPLVIGDDNDRKREIEEYWPYLPDDDRDTLAILARTLYEKRIEYETNDKPKQETHPA